MPVALGTISQVSLGHGGIHQLQVACLALCSGRGVVFACPLEPAGFSALPCLQTRFSCTSGTSKDSPGIPAQQLELCTCGDARPPFSPSWALPQQTLYCSVNEERSAWWPFAHIENIATLHSFLSPTPADSEALPFPHASNHTSASSDPFS